MSLATDKSKVMAYMDGPVKQELERLAEIRNRSMSNLIETLVLAEIQRARESGELPEQSEVKA